MNAVLVESRALACEFEVDRKMLFQQSPRPRSVQFKADEKEAVPSHRQGSHMGARWAAQAGQATLLLSRLRAR
jgi:hypothetical protein